MRKALLIVALLAVLLIGAKKPPVRLVRFTVVNKSGRVLEIRMTGSCDENFYYLHVPKGTRLWPQVSTFTVIPDEYSTQTHYVELWDPVYGPSCSDKSLSLDLNRNIRMLVLECDRTPANGGEKPAILKLGGRNSRAGGRRR